jgi:hypothetical protein
VDGRSREGTDASEAGHAVQERQLAGVEPLGDDELPDAVLVDTSAGNGLPAGVLDSLAQRLALDIARPGAAGKDPRQRDG